MPMTECKIDLDLALTLRELINKVSSGPPKKDLFRCVECNKPVFPQGGKNERFTHWEKNPDCPFSG